MRFYLVSSIRAFARQDWPIVGTALALTVLVILLPDVSIFNSALGPTQFKAAWSFVGVGLFLDCFLGMVSLSKAMALQRSNRSGDLQTLLDLGVSLKSLRVGLFSEFGIASAIGLLLGVVFSAVFRFPYIRLVELTGLLPDDGRFLPAVRSVVLGLVTTLLISSVLAVFNVVNLHLGNHFRLKGMFSAGRVVGICASTAAVFGSIYSYLDSATETKRTNLASGVGFTVCVLLIFVWPIVCSFLARFVIKLSPIKCRPCALLAFSQHRSISSPIHSLTVSIIAFCSVASVPLCNTDISQVSQLVRVFTVIQLPIFVFIGMSIMQMAGATESSLRPVAIVVTDLGFTRSQTIRINLIMLMLSWIFGAIGGVIPVGITLYLAYYPFGILQITAIATPFLLAFIFTYLGGLIGKRRLLKGWSRA